MKKSIFTISFIILALFFSFTYVFAANAGEQMINGMKETTEGAGNALKDVTNGAIGTIRNGADNIKDTAAIRLLNIILGGNPSSRLFTDLREQEKLAYQVKSSYSSQDDIGILSLKIGTTTDNKETGEKHFDNIKKSIDGFNKHIEKIKNEKVSEEELKNAKLYLKNNILNNNHSSISKASNLLKSANTPYSIHKTNLLLEEVDKISVDDIYNAANYIFSNRPTYSILATKDTLNANKDYFKSLEN